MYRRYIKRALDLILAISMLPFLLLLCLILCPLIFLEDGGSPFYVSKRLGKGGRTFKMYKFRTMKRNAPDIRNADGSTYNAKNDPRLTRIGAFLRSSSLDELPQIINILKNEMSFIGPRPDLPEHIKLYSNKELKKLSVLPGITGYNQAYFRNSVSFKERLKNDLYYIRHLSFCLDLKIFIKTIEGIVLRRGVYGR
ncbi:MAG: sugar transferase [Clostridiales bacterium]|nr:sugar transferase [Clostridiales bacterium]